MISLIFLILVLVYLIVFLPVSYINYRLNMIDRYEKYIHYITDEDTYNTKYGFSISTILILILPLSIGFFILNRIEYTNSISINLIYFSYYIVVYGGLIFYFGNNESCYCDTRYQDLDTEFEEFLYFINWKFIGLGLSFCSLVCTIMYYLL